MFRFASTLLPVVAPDSNRLAPDAALRPTRIGILGQIAIGVLLAASFISGLLIWRGKHLQLVNGESPGWLHSVVVVHGCLNPILCILFGILLAHHIRVGWQMRANLLSGVVMEAAFFGMILTGLGLYYTGSEEWRQRISLAHRICGLALPVGLAWHWFAGLNWGRRIGQKSQAG